jgi:hypothetical protein
MPSRNEMLHARERLQLAAPISDEASLSILKDDVAEFLREAKSKDAVDAHELVSTVVDEIARKYFQYALRQQARLPPYRRRRLRLPAKVIRGSLLIVGAASTCASVGQSLLQRRLAPLPSDRRASRYFENEKLFHDALVRSNDQPLLAISNCAQGLK